MHNQGLRGTISPRDKTNPAGCQPNISITWGISQQVSFEDFVQVYLAFDKTCQRLKSKHVKCNKKVPFFPRRPATWLRDCLKNIVLQFVVILCMRKYFSGYLIYIEALLHIENYSGFRFVHMHRFLKFGSIEECFCLWSQDHFTFLPGYFCWKFWCNFLRHRFYSLILKQKCT